MEAGAVSSTRFELTTTHVMSNPMGSVHTVIQSYINSNPDLSYSIPRTTMENYKGTLLSYLEGFKTPTHIIVLILKDWQRTMYWWKAARDNRQKTPSLKPEDFDNVQNEFDFYSSRMEKALQDLEKLKDDAQILLVLVENLLSKHPTAAHAVQPTSTTAALEPNAISRQEED